MQSFKLKNLLYFLVFFALISFIMVFTFYDLEITEKFYRGDSIFTKIFDYVGKLPAFIILYFASSVLARCVDIDFESSTSSLKWLYRILTLFAGMMFFYSIIENYLTEGIVPIILSAAFGAVSLVISMLVMSKIDRNKLIQIEKWCVMAVVVTVLSFLSITMLKIIVGRPRYIEILKDSSIYKFMPWYSPDWFGEGNSFPSGHVGLASTLALVPMLLKSLKCRLAIKLPIYLLCVAFIFSTLAARIIAGHHFLTDVLISLFIVCTLYFLAELILYRNNKLVFENSNTVEKAFKLGYKN